MYLHHVCLIFYIDLKTGKISSNLSFQKWLPFFVFFFVLCDFGSFYISAVLPARGLTFFPIELPITFSLYPWTKSFNWLAESGFLEWSKPMDLRKSGSNSWPSDTVAIFEDSLLATGRLVKSGKGKEIIFLYS